ncbi:MAG: hypothetical protein IT319_17250 [Anaerolineae bacterium]|nr:hypothetical protein [Anaerolineae bacterium]
MRIIRLLAILLVLGGVAVSTAQPTLTITSPVPYLVYQRHSGVSNIPIRGTVDATGTIEARFNGGGWQPIARAANRVFSGMLENQPQGQGALEIRLADAPDVTAAVPYVGVGDVFVIAGQSNASGRGDHPQSAGHEWLKAALFGNDYQWHELRDPTDSDAGQVDGVSIDFEAAGSVWTLVAGHHMGATGVPVAFVPAAKGGSSVTAWLPGRDPFNRATLYGSMAYRARLTGAKAVLWWQGETDALDGMAQADYQRQFQQVATAIRRDLGIPIMPALIHNSMAIPDDAEAEIRRAVVEAANAVDTVLLGPDLSDLASDDQYHLRSDTNLQIAAERWWRAMQPLVG